MRRGGCRLVLCERLAGIPGVVHAFSTRRSVFRGTEPIDFDLGSAADESPPYPERRRMLSDAAGLTDQLPLRMKQVHGARVVRLRAGSGETLEQADAAISLRGDGAARFPAVRSADCVPLLLADRGGRAVAAVHAGWRGAAAGIAGRTVEQLKQLGVAPARLCAAVGPAIGGCCYDVGPEVLEAVSAGSGVPAARLVLSAASGRERLDLRLAVWWQLVRAGVPEVAVSTAPWCTSCHEELFYSHRRDGAAAGRMMAVIGWKPRLA